MQYTGADAVSTATICTSYVPPGAIAGSGVIVMLVIATPPTAVGQASEVTTPALGAGRRACARE